MSPYQDLTGRRFGRLVAVRYIPGDRSKRGSWVCVCACGATARVQTSNLTTGHTSSCGCFREEAGRVRNRTHGHRTGRKHSGEYTSWAGMRQRCHNPNNSVYRFYGGRGIEVCERWRSSFDAFLADMGEKPEPKEEYSLDRIDPDGPYSPENCRWVHFKKQANNRRSNHFVNHDGETLTIAEWSNRTSIKQSTLRERLRRGWSMSEALNAPKYQRRPRGGAR